MILATCFNWLERPVFGNVVLMAGSVLKMALMSTPCWVTPLVPAIMVAVLSIVRRKFMEFLRATSVAEPVKPFRTRTEVSAPVPIESGRWSRPIVNEVEPEIEVSVGKLDPALHGSTESTTRPPHPVGDLVSARAVCWAWTWSECEKREK